MKYIFNFFSYLNVAPRLFSGFRPREPLEHPEEGEVLHDSQIGDEHVVLWTEAEAAPRLGHISADVEAVDVSLASGGRIHASQDRHRRRLARAIMAEQGGHTTTISLLAEKLL